MINEGLDELKQDREELIRAHKKNRLEIKGLLTKIYPDSAHFIFELLQNAEDKGARHATFILTPTGLEFSHDGPKLFTYDNLDAITIIRNNTKPDESPRIGQFGVGFKSVFAYTNTPEIHSGNYHFQIHDLVVPEHIIVDNPLKWGKITAFSFPFNNPDKPAPKAIEEITHGLNGLDDNVLLFLSNITKIEYTLPDGNKSSLERIELEDHKVKIQVNKPGENSTIDTLWLRFVKKVSIQDEDEQTKECTIATAYQMEQDKENKQKIIPINGKVSIFFPAKNEQSQLQFHIHVPFIPTVARDKRQDCETNDKLRDEMATFIAEQLSVIRDYGLLTMGFLAVMPNSADGLVDEFYKPILDKVITAFQNEPLTPTKSRSHAPSKILYRGPDAMSDLLGDEGLRIFVRKPESLWVDNVPSENTRVDNFLPCLNIPALRGKDLLDKLKEPQEQIEKWLAKKDDSWLKNFYALLGTEVTFQQLRNFRLDNSINIKFVRTTSPEGDQMVSPPDAQFLPEEEIRLPKDIHFVKKEVYEDKDSDAFKFLERIGVKPFDVREARAQEAIEKQQIVEENAIRELGLERYGRGKVLSIDSDYYDDLTRFVEFWKKDPQTGRNLFSKLLFLYSEEGEHGFRDKPTHFYLDLPYKKTGLERIASIHGKRKLWEGYETSLDPAILSDWVRFLVDIGVKHKIDELEIKLHEGTFRVRDKLKKEFPNTRAQWGGWTKQATEICEDYKMPSSIDIEYLYNSTIESSYQIWQTLIKAEKKVAFARYSPNRQHQPKTMKSYIVELLESHAWIPDTEGNFFTPQEMTQETLHEHFHYDDSNGLLTAIGFGLEAREDLEHQNSIARTWGFNSAEEARESARKSRKKHPFPERPVQNKPRRREKTAGNARNAPQKTYESRIRTVRTSNSSIDPDDYLYRSYTTDDDVLICQICEEEMPFIKRDGRYYFEAVEIFGKQHFPKEHETQYIALCPECAAMYKEFIKKDNDAMSGLHERLKSASDDDLKIQLQLGDRNTSIRFVEAHWLDLLELLRQ